MENKSLNVIYGEKKIILSAPHSVLHKRKGSIRPRETRTGLIVNNLSKKCKTYGIYKKKAELNDANWDRKCNYKKYLRELIKKEKIKALIDVHGMAKWREQDICIGINGGKNIQGNYKVLNSIIKIFNSYGFNNVTIDNPFGAVYKYCVSNYISRKCKIPCFQIEINLKYRSAKYKEYKDYNKLLETFEKVIQTLDEEL